MDGKIYDLLMKIDNIGIAKFGLSKDDRIFLKQLLLDQIYLNKFIDLYSIDKVREFLTGIYDNLNAINVNIIELKEKSNDIKESVNALFTKEICNLEKEREEKIELLINNKIHEGDVKKRELDDLELYNKIKQNLKN